MKKYIFVTGGVCSSLGKGLASASIAALLERHGAKVCMVKIDPYLNVDAGTMSPYQHGEVYVTDDGSETDLDLGNYFRFTSSPLGRENSITSGQIYQEVIRREREGRDLGQTIQMIPHATDEIKRRILRAGEINDADVTIVEVGGTVGDMESIPFLEAIRQFPHDWGKDNCLYVHLTLVPKVAGEELKTKPTQHSVNKLREIGIQPDILLCRAPEKITGPMREKISLFTNVEKESVISAHDVKSTIYENPLVYYRQGLHEIIFKKLKLTPSSADMEVWEEIVKGLTEPSQTVRIAMVGKYTNLSDSYKSVNEALIHGGLANGVKVEIKRIDSEELEKPENQDGLEDMFKNIHGILIPGGFGKRGIDGMIRAAEFARTRNIPLLGICLGLQIMVIEYARNVMGLAGANSTEIDKKTPWPVISLLAEQTGVTEYGGTMRLGLSETRLFPGTKIREAYGRDVIFERHRHRYEVSVRYRQQLEEAGLIVTGCTPGNALVESVEWPRHPWGCGVQFHPEFTSRPTAPHPFFAAFIEAAKNGSLTIGKGTPTYLYLDDNYNPLPVPPAKDAPDPGKTALVVPDNPGAQGVMVIAETSPSGGDDIVRIINSSEAGIISLFFHKNENFPWAMNLQSREETAGARLSPYDGEKQRYSVTLEKGGVSRTLNDLILNKTILTGWAGEPENAGTQNDRMQRAITALGLLLSLGQIFPGENQAALNFSPLGLLKNLVTPLPAASFAVSVILAPPRAARLAEGVCPVAKPAPAAGGELVRQRRAAIEKLYQNYSRAFEQPEPPAFDKAQREWQAQEDFIGGLEKLKTEYKQGAEEAVMECLKKINPAVFLPEPLDFAMNNRKI
jgi:CTP synthase